MNPLDFITGGVGIINKLIELHKLDQWAKLIISFALSWFVAFTGEVGHRLIAGAPWPVAVGWGLLAGNTVICTLFYLNKQTKGMAIALFKSQPLASSDVEVTQK